MSVKISEESIQRIPHSCIVKIQAVYDSLKSAEKKAVDLLLERPDFFAGASITEAGEEAKCSEATLVRLAKKLGYAGYPELKAHLNKGDQDTPLQLYGNITENDSYENVALKVFKASIQALHDTLVLLNKEEYAKAVNALCHADKIVFCGVGDAAAVAQSGYQKFLRVGFNVQSSSDIDVQLIMTSHLKKGDVLFAISHSGRTRSIIDVVKYARSIGATVISITNFPIAPLAKNSDIVLLTAAFTQHMEGEVMSKRVAELCIIESLFVNVLLKNRRDMSEKLELSNAAIGINKL